MSDILEEVFCGLEPIMDQVQAMPTTQPQYQEYQHHPHLPPMTRKHLLRLRRRTTSRGLGGSRTTRRGRRCSRRRAATRWWRPLMLDLLPLFHPHDRPPRSTALLLHLVLLSQVPKLQHKSDLLVHHQLLQEPPLKPVYLVPLSQLQDPHLLQTFLPHQSQPHPIVSLLLLKTFPCRQKCCQTLKAQVLRAQHLLLKNTSNQPMAS